MFKTASVRTALKKKKVYGVCNEKKAGNFTITNFLAFVILLHFKHAKTFENRNVNRYAYIYNSIRPLLDRFALHCGRFTLQSFKFIFPQITKYLSFNSSSFSLLFLLPFNVANSFSSGGVFCMRGERCVTASVSYG